MDKDAVSSHSVRCHSILTACCRDGASAWKTNVQGYVASQLGALSRPHHGEGA